MRRGHVLSCPTRLVRRMSAEARWMTTRDVIGAITEQYARLTRAVDTLGPVAATAWVTAEDGWTAKDVIAWYPWPDRPLWAFVGGDTFLVEWPAHAEQMERAAARIAT